MHAVGFNWSHILTCIKQMWTMDNSHIYSMWATPIVLFEAVAKFVSISNHCCIAICCKLLWTVANLCFVYMFHIVAKFLSISNHCYVSISNCCFVTICFKSLICFYLFQIIALFLSVSNHCYVCVYLLQIITLFLSLSSHCHSFCLFHTGM